MGIHVRMEILESIGYVASRKEIMEITLTALNMKEGIFFLIVNSYGNLVLNIWMEKIGKFTCWIALMKKMLYTSATSPTLIKGLLFLSCCSTV